LDLQFWADTPSGEHQELAEIKTKKLSPGEEVSYTAKITPKKKDTTMYTGACMITTEGLVGNLIQFGLKNSVGNVILL